MQDFTPTTKLTRLTALQRKALEAVFRGDARVVITATTVTFSADAADALAMTTHARELLLDAGHPARGGHVASLNAPIRRLHELAQRAEAQEAVYRRFVTELFLIYPADKLREEITHGPRIAAEAAQAELDRRAAERDAAARVCSTPANHSAQITTVDQTSDLEAVAAYLTGYLGADAEVRTGSGFLSVRWPAADAASR
jgi:hypothetical protein